MKNKVILISIDGMRPDGLRACGNPYLRELEATSAYTYTGQSVFPSVTLPCHFSMAHSVSPQRHGILTNLYVPQVRPVQGIFEAIRAAGGVSAMCYGWEQMRDIAQPGSLQFATYIHAYARESTDTVLTDTALRMLAEDKPDFLFLYLVETDEKGGHDHGWMSEEYLKCIYRAIDNVRRVIEAFGDEYTVIIMSDHGEAPEDMTVPFFFHGPAFTPGRIDTPLSLLDIAPTIATLLGIPADRDWEGTPAPMQKI